MKIQFIGCGKIGELILSSVIESGVESSSISVQTSNEESASYICEKYGVNHGVDSESDIIVLAIKPQNLEEIDFSVFSSSAFLISILAGVSLKNLEEKTGFKNIVRSMPNLPLSVGKGLTGYITSKETSEKYEMLFEKFFEKSGKTLKLKNDDEIDKLTSISGSGPAYFYYFTKLIEQKSIELGFSPEQSELIAGSTFVGSAELFEKMDKSVGELKDQVTSKGGTTEAALKSFEENDLFSVVSDGIDAAYNRSKDLNK